MKYGKQEKFERKITSTFTIQPSLLRQFQKTAKKIGLSQSLILRILIKDFVGGVTSGALDLASLYED